MHTLRRWLYCIGIVSLLAGCGGGGGSSDGGGGAAVHGLSANNGNLGGTGGGFSSGTAGNGTGGSSGSASTAGTTGGTAGNSASTGGTPGATTASGASPSPTPSGSSPTIAGCEIFPPDNPWNTDISQYPPDPNAATYLTSMKASTTNLHPDFGTDPTYGIPFVVVDGSQPLVPMVFNQSPDESDPGPYPFPPNAPVEGGAGSTGDRHVLVVDSGNCTLYETFDSFYTGPGWTAGSGARFDLSSNALRPDYWTSADAAGLPIFAGLARYDECAAGHIGHALRCTMHATQNGFIHPATHFAGSNNPTLPPMGLRLRLSASFDTSGYDGAALVILTALKQYGMFVADNGSDFYITGAPDPRWDDNNLDELKTVPASAFEVVQTGSIIH